MTNPTIFFEIFGFAHMIIIALSSWNNILYKKYMKKFLLIECKVWDQIEKFSQDLTKLSHYDSLIIHALLIKKYVINIHEILKE